MLVTGDNMGQLLLLSLDGQKVITHPSIVAFLLQIKVILLRSSMLSSCHKFSDIKAVILFIFMAYFYRFSATSCTKPK